jgi:hypothetical protein
MITYLDGHLAWGNQILLDGRPLSGVNAALSEDIQIAALDDGTLLLSIGGSPTVAIDVSTP